MANKENLSLVWDFIKAHRSMLRMDRWLDSENIDVKAVREGRYNECGTTACVAGWTGLLFGWLPVDSCVFVSPDGKQVRDIEYVAMGILELTSIEKDRLFFCDNNDLDEIMDELLGDYASTAA